MCGMALSPWILNNILRRSLIDLHGLFRVRQCCWNGLVRLRIDYMFGVGSRVGVRVRVSTCIVTVTVTVPGIVRGIVPGIVPGTVRIQLYRRYLFLCSV